MSCPDCSNEVAAVRARVERVRALQDENAKLRAEARGATDAHRDAVASNDKLIAERDRLLLQVSELQKFSDGQSETLRRVISERQAAVSQLRELQERYDIYAKHLKTCVVWIAPEIPCDCGFLTTTQKRSCGGHYGDAGKALKCPDCNKT